MAKFNFISLIKTLLALGIAVFGLYLPQNLFETKVMITSDASVGVAAEELTTQVMKGIKLISSSESEVDWAMNSESATAFSSNTWRLKNCNLSLKSSNAKIDLTSKSGFIDLNTKNLNLVGDVKANSSNGFSFQTNEIFFNSENNEAYTEDYIELVNQTEKIKVNAKGLKGDIKTGELELLNEVRCEQSILGFDNIVIKSNRAKIRSNLNDIRFMDNLRVQQQEFTIKGEEAFFAYDEKNKGELKSIKVQGKIRASDGIKTALSEKVEMKIKEDVILFQGNPKLIMGENEMVGEEILITNKQKNIQVLGGNIKSSQDSLESKED